MLTFHDVTSYFNGKDIALVGNAESILSKCYPIDSHESVCRINAGSPKGKELALGTRTDVLFTGNWGLSSGIIAYMAPQLIVAYYSRGDSLPEGLKLDRRVYQWLGSEDLRGYLGKDPSTGIAAFYIITRFTKFKSLTLYGFDWWKTKTWHTGVKWFDSHNARGEKKFILDTWLQDTRITVCLEDDNEP